jgi:hypothetical protein
LKTTLALLLALAAALIIGCGGGGGGGGSTTATTDATTATSIRIEATYASNTDQTIDLVNLRVGDQLQLRLWGRDATTNNPVLVPSSNWSTTAPSSSLTVTSAGRLTVIGSGATSYLVYANNRSYSATALVKATQPRLVGRVLNDGGVGATRAKLLFYNASGTEVASAFTGSNGSFAATMPTTAKTFLVDMSERTGAYYNQFGFGPSDYNLSCTNRAPLPALSLGTDTTLLSGGGGSIEVYRVIAGSPPPPPPDCGLGG